MIGAGSSAWTVMVWQKLRFTTRNLRRAVAARSDPIWMTDMGFSSEAQSAIDEVLRADDWGLSSADFQLPPAGDLPNSIDDQALNEIKLDLAILKYARYARGGRTVPVQLSKLYGMTPSLRDPKTVLAEIADAPEPSVYLQGLHPKHVQFQRLHQALLKARAETDAGAKSANLQKIVVNMERWRWMPENLGSLHILLNVPAFMVYVARDGKVVYTDKIVVGELKYATPIFSAELKSVVFNPEWTVPPTIVRENLLPSLRGGGLFGGGTSILTQHELNVNYNGKRVDPSSIDWNRVNMGAISFTQAPGPNNVLGKVKFVYPNPYSVYMHDTIKQGLFDKDMRAEGHNCPRVEHPGKIAAAPELFTPSPCRFLVPLDVVLVDRIRALRKERVECVVDRRLLEVVAHTDIHRETLVSPLILRKDHADVCRHRDVTRCRHPDKESLGIR